MDEFPCSDDDLAFVSFKDVTWLQAFKLDETNVLDYFALSQFFDRSCNNQVVRMQLQFSSGNPAEQHQNLSFIKTKLKEMKGIEYEVFKSFEPQLFIIHKQYRHSPSSVQIQTIYYVLNGAIYQSPNLNTLISHRVISSLYYLNEAMEYARKFIHFDPIKSRYKIDSINQKTKTLEGTSSLHQVHIDKIDFITRVNSKFMNSK